MKEAILELCKTIIVDQFSLQEEDYSVHKRLASDYDADALDIVDIAMTIEDETDIDASIAYDASFVMKQDMTVLEFVEYLCAETKRNAEKTLAEEKLRAERIANGVCQYCGGTFKKKLFSTKCTSCSRPKDY